MNRSGASLARHVKSHEHPDLSLQARIWQEVRYSLREGMTMFAVAVGTAELVRGMYTAMERYEVPLRSALGGTGYAMVHIGAPALVAVYSLYASSAITRDARRHTDGRTCPLVIVADD